MLRIIRNVNEPEKIFHAEQLGEVHAFFSMCV